MRALMRRIALCSAAATATVAAVSLPGALDARRAAIESSLESSVLSYDIAFLEARVSADAENWLLAGHLADLYALRFQTTADLTDIVRAEALARSSLRLRPDASPGHARLAALLLTQHRFVEAYEAARSAVGVATPGDAALATFVDAARAIGDYGPADSALARITPGTFAASVRTADGRATAGRARSAVRRVHRACQRLDELGLPRELRAWCLTRLAAAEHARNGPAAARRWLLRALAVQPRHRGATEQLADLAYAQGRWAEAGKLYARILADAHPDLHLRLAEVNRALARDDIAARHEQRFVELASASGAEALNALPLALHHARSGRCEDAARLAHDELDRRRSTEALEAVAWIHFDCGDPRAAAGLLTDAERANGLSPSGTYLHGLLLRQQGDHVAAGVRIAGATADPTLLAHHALQHLRRQRGGAS